MAPDVEDRLAVMELVALHRHLVDDGELDRLDELFTEDIVYGRPARARGGLPRG
ncbi:nuclear transport factor 2 family protein [Streptomyces sp. NPDC048445]|uniref:nuclear transport factor 2 family protein n=1 Tax=Streptomyces sp. NPDC048445 TaxID=3365553 RepID=UPI0037138969